MCPCIVSSDQIARLNVGTTQRISKMCLNALGVTGSASLCVFVLEEFCLKKNQSLAKFVFLC